MLKRVTYSDTLVVPLDEMVEHLRRGDTNEDDRYIVRCIRAATTHIENWCGISLVEQRWDYFFDGYPDGLDPYGRYIIIPRPPLLEIEGVFYRSSGTTFSEFGQYDIDYADSKILLMASGSWPNVEASKNSGRIRFRSGYIDESSPVSEGDVPEDLKAAIQIYAANLYENRESFAVGTAFNVAKFPWGVENIIRHYRVDTSLA